MNNTPIISQPDVFQRLVDDHQRYGRTGEDRSAGNGGIRADDEPSHKYDEQHARGAAAEAGDTLPRGAMPAVVTISVGRPHRDLPCLSSARERGTPPPRLLCLSQPAVTRSIHRLEESLGCKLFTRVSRGVRLTVEGTALFPMWTALSNLCPTANAS